MCPPLSPSLGQPGSLAYVALPQHQLLEASLEHFLGLCVGSAGETEAQGGTLTCPGHPRNPLPLGSMGKQPAGPCPGDRSDPRLSARCGFKSHQLAQSSPVGGARWCCLRVAGAPSEASTLARAGAQQISLCPLPALRCAGPAQGCRQAWRDRFKSWPCL